MRILVVDDEKNIGEVIRLLFSHDGFEVETCLTGREGLAKMEKGLYDVVISDIRLPDITGIEILRWVQEHTPEIPVVLITAYASTSQAIEAMKIGAEDYIIKPFDINELRVVVSKAYEKRKLRIENLRLRKELEESHGFSNLLGRCKPMQRVFVFIDKIAPTDSTVLITGESGTGKDLVAQAIHYRSHRKENPFVSINCASIPENLLESELFGYKRGAFTGAVADKVGLFQEASGGTLFLDEIGEMPLSLQAKILRVLQDKKVRRLGENTEKNVDVRVVAATNHNLGARIEAGLFREDLYYRLNVLQIDLPPLRHRPEDIPLLFNHFLELQNRKQNKNISGAEPKLMEIFYNYRWPGTVRQMEHIVERLVVLSEGDQLTTDLLPPDFLREYGRQESFQPGLLKEGFSLTDYLDGLTREIILKALAQSGNNRRETARSLGLSYRSLRYYIEKYGLRE